MKREDIRKVFPEASEEQIDSLLNQAGLEINAVKSQLSAANSQHSADIASQKQEFEQQIAQLNEQLKAGMSEEERLKTAVEEAEKRAADFSMKSNMLDAKEVFVAAGLSEDAYKPILSQVVVADAKETKKNAEAIVNLLKSQRESAEQALKDELLKGNPGLQGGASNTAMTKEAFDKLDYMAKLEVLKDNPGFLSTIQQTNPVI